jgi:hypothetical protein
MKKIILLLIGLGIGSFGYSQSSVKNPAMVKTGQKNNEISKTKLSDQEIHTHTYTRIPKSKVKELKIVHPTANKHLIKRATPEEAARLREIRDKQKNKQQ